MLGTFFAIVTPVINQRPEPPLDTHTAIHTTVSNGARRHYNNGNTGLDAADSLFLTLWF